MTTHVGKCLICNRIFEAGDKNRGTLTVGDFTKPVDVCDYHLQMVELDVTLARQIVEAQGKR